MPNNPVIARMGGGQYVPNHEWAIYNMPEDCPLYSAVFPSRRKAAEALLLYYIELVLQAAGVKCE